MCGIVGIVNYSKEKKQENLNIALRTIKHRGPDDEGWKAAPFCWYALYQLVLLEVWFRIYIKGQDYRNIKPKNA